MTDVPSILCDVVQSISVHNGVARIVLGRLDPQGDANSVVELLLPMPIVNGIAIGMLSIVPRPPMVRSIG